MQAVGALVGGYTSYQSVKNSNMSNMDKVMHTLGGAAVGAITSFATGVKVLKGVAEGFKAATNVTKATLATQSVKGGVTGGLSGAATQLTTDAVTGQESSIEKTAKATGKGVVIGIATTLTAVAVVGESILGVTVAAAETVGLTKALE
jgi:hypothetical protein